MNGVTALAYIGLTCTDVVAWSDFAERLLGARTEPGAPASVVVRVDERALRVLLTAGDADDLAFVGWEVPDSRSLEAVRHALRAAGRETRPMSEGERASRRVADGLVAEDPNGLRIEVVTEAAVGGTPFVSGAGARFVCGDLGLGHVVLYVDDLQESLQFYSSVLGFSVTDTIHVGGTQVLFLRCNERHHSLALVPGRRDRWLQHLMLEVETTDMVGVAFDRCDAEQKAQSTIGRHTNDLMFSFYAQPPGCSYTIEYGHGGRLVPPTAAVVSYDSTSWWGHKDQLPGQL